MAFLQKEYTVKCEESSDINEHLPTLYAYAKECSHITECGVRNVVSSYAFALGLLESRNPKIVQIDPYRSDSLEYFEDLCDLYGIHHTFFEQSDLESPMEQTNLLFIDTWHVYGQLKRELDRWHSVVSRYIILHDTTVDEWIGESVRMNHPIEEEILSSGFPVEEIKRGLWPAVEGFLAAHPEWKLHARFTNNNGLTILRRE